MATKDYYKTLGVSETATAEEIKKAYRKLARKNHPDVTGGDKSKEAKFKEISEAYEIVGDEKKRAQFDEQRKNPFAGGGFPGGGQPGGGAGYNVDLNDLFSQFGGGRGGQGGGRTYTYSGGVPGADGEAGGFGDLFEMFRGQQGGAPGGGRGRAQSRKGGDVVAKLDIELPEAALGAEKAIVVEDKRLNVKIPAGVTDGKTIRLTGQGQPAPRGGTAGDLLIELHVKPHARFRRLANPDDIEVDVQVPLEAAVLGGKAHVPTLEGTSLTLSIPAGSSSGRRLRLKGKGAAPTGKPRGDLYAIVQIHVPAELSADAKTAFEEFVKLTKK
ncbi:MAG TPA: DnaJ C-terminal domain-containing protein [Polyangia bacterium]|jgi:molecular chaperone DnaJ|nr:DnaJ C-terminal domain-containing protein [Polyangia bacterium]